MQIDENDYYSQANLLIYRQDRCPFLWEECLKSHLLAIFQQSYRIFLLTFMFILV